MAALNRAKVRAFARRAKRAVDYERIARARRAPIDAGLVFYESFSGNGMLCNPEAIFRALLRADDQRHLRHVWALADLSQHAETMAEFAGDPRISFVEYNSHAYYAALSRAKYLVNNATFPSKFGKRAGQIYVNTWHGTPLKAMGYDVPGGALSTRNIVRNFLSADYLLAPNADTAEMYLSAYRMRNIFAGTMIAEGTPRIDRQFVDGAAAERIKDRMRSSGVVLGPEQQIVLYAPTWHGNFYAPTNDIRQLRARIQAVSSQIDTTRYRLLLKVHQTVYKHAAADDDLRSLLVPNDIPANEVLGATSVLITDYSSIFVDYLASGRPVLFFAPDLDEYAAERGLNVPADAWPGPVCRTLEQLVEELKHLGSGSDEDAIVRYQQAYTAMRERYCPREDGSAADRLVDIVFRGRTAGYDLRRDFSDGRIQILIHLGGMLNNGITVAGLSLLSNIDYSRFDVSATFPYRTHRDRVAMINRIDPRVRLIPRLGGMNGSKVHVVPLAAVSHRSAAQHRATAERYRPLLREEWLRCFGDSSFDHVIDYSGYAPFWVKLLASRPSGSLSLWLHNDMRAEVENPGRSEYLRNSVAGVQALYGLADHLVSVSPALNEVNRQRLADCAPAERFTYARNTIDFGSIRHLAYGQTPEISVNAAAVRAPAPDQALPDWIEVVANHYGLANVMDEVNRRAVLARVLPPRPGVRTFVTAGRLSEEKNHARLIRAFASVHEENPLTRLVILGTGALRSRLVILVDELGVASAVRLAGYQRNPYAIVASSDCFVLSSDYEGQPMVLLEALVLGKPIVTTAFESVRSALPDGVGLVVARDDKALAEGMRAFLRGEVPAPPFDPAAYNQQAIDEFYSAVGAVSQG